MRGWGLGARERTYFRSLASSDLSLTTYHAPRTTILKDDLLLLPILDYGGLGLRDRVW